MAVCLLLSAHHAVIFAIVQFSCFCFIKVLSTLYLPSLVERLHAGISRFLDFYIPEILMVGNVQRSKMHHSAKFGQNRSNSC